MSKYHRLDDVVMSEVDRERAKAHMRSAELTIDFVFAAVEKARLLATALRRRLMSLPLSPQDLRRQATQQ